MKIIVLRLGHRTGRDKRLTTHVCLTARALGASQIIYSGDKDSKMEENIRDIVERWGGNFEIFYSKNWKKTIKNFDGIKVYLTMYGKPLQKKIGEIRNKKEKLIIIVGSEKVPREVYDLVDYNIAVTNQPHSEVGSLSIFLHELYEGRELEKNFENPKLKIIPQEKGKKLIEKN